MKQHRRTAIALVVIGAATLVRTPRAESPFGPAAAEARNATTPGSTYDFFLDLPASDTAAGKKLLRRAIKLQADEKYQDAITEYDKAAARLPQIADWINVFAASAAARLGDTAQVKRRLRDVDDVLADEWAWRTRSVAFERAAAPGRALEVAQAATRSGTAAKRAAAWYRVAELQRDAGNAEARKEALFSALKVATESEAGTDAARELAALNGLSVTERRRVGRVLMRNGEVNQGVRLLEQTLDSGPVSSEEAEVHYELARALFSVRRYADAENHLLRIPSTSARAADARFLLARVYAREGKDEPSRRTLNIVFSDYPKSRAATRSLFLLGDFAHDQGDVDDALALFERAADAPTRSEESAQALMRTGGIAFARGDFASATATFDTFRARYASGEFHQQATYWSALSRIRAGNATAGKALLREVRRDAPLSYYGIRAANLLGDKPLDVELAASPRTPEEAGAHVRKGITRWKLLDDVEWHAAAAFELRRLKQRFADDRAATYEIAEQLQKRGAPHLALGIGRELLQGGEQWNRRLLKIMYPMPFKTLIERHANAHGLDPYFVTAVIRQESRFNNKAMSGAGAVGLMQVMPSTGKQLGNRTKKATITVAKLKQPDVNLRLGTKFLSDLMDMYGNRVDAALAAYNAGPSRAYRWRNFPEFATEDLFIERIPFDETREYVKAIKSNMTIYRALYGARQSAD